MISVLNADTGLTRIECDVCSIRHETVFEATPAHHPHFDPVEEIEWFRMGGEIRCPDCAKPGRSSITVRSAHEHGPGMAWVQHTCTCGLFRGAVMPFEDTQGAGWAERCLAAVGGGGTIKDHRGDAQDVCPDCFQRNQRENKTMTTTNETTSTSNGTHADPIKTMNESRELTVPLTVAEIAERGERAAMLLGQIETKKTALKVENSLKKADIADLEGRLQKISKEVQAKTRLANVPVRLEWIFRTNTYREVRCDNGAVLIERPLTEDERQLELPAVNEDTDEDEGPRNWPPKEGVDEPSDSADEQESEDEASGRVVREELSAAGVDTIEDFAESMKSPGGDEPEPQLETARGKRRKGGKSKAAASEGAE